MRIIRKLRNNLLTQRAVSVLGLPLYLRYLAALAGGLPAMARARDLRPIDRVLSAQARIFRYRGTLIHFDYPYCDEHFADGTFAFGAVRELYIRDCYFKWHPPAVFERIRTAVDLGANRGAFSALVASRAQFVLSVECDPRCVPLIRHNVELNRPAAYAGENVFAGAGGAFGEQGPRSSLDELLVRHGLDRVDFLKLDVEGSEFALFAEPGWLRKVEALSLEVHTPYGDPARILSTLAQYGFAHIAADENLERVNAPDRANFIYAYRTR